MESQITPKSQVDTPKKWSRPFQRLPGIQTLNYSSLHWKKSRSFPEPRKRSGIWDRAETLHPVDRPAAPSKIERRIARYQHGLAKAKDRKKRQRPLQKP